MHSGELSLEDAKLLDCNLETCELMDKESAENLKWIHTCGFEEMDIEEIKEREEETVKESEFSLNGIPLLTFQQKVNKMLVFFQRFNVKNHILFFI